MAVIGAAGLIGSGTVRQLAVSGACDVVYLVDVRQDLCRAHAIDIGEAQVPAGSTRTRLEVLGSAADAGAVDLVVLAASRPETPAGDRRVFLAANFALLRGLAADVLRLAGDRGLVLLLSNPVDILADAFCRHTGLDPRRVAGYALNDSIRFRAALGRELGVDATRIDATVLGEHGTGLVPVFSRIRVDGTPRQLDARARGRVRDDLDGWFARWSALRPGRSSGWLTPLGVLQMLRAVADAQVVPASVWTGDRPDLPDTFVTLPARLSPHGLAATERWELDEDEARRLREAAGSVSTAAASTAAASPDVTGGR